jgi:hypothetical protein
LPVFERKNRARIWMTTIHGIGPMSISKTSNHKEEFGMSSLKNQRIFSVFFLLTLVVLVSCNEKEAENISAINFSRIEINSENIEKYPFLSSTRDEINREKSDFEKFKNENLKYENRNYREPIVSIAHTTINKTQITIEKVQDNSSLRIYCGSEGCSHAFFINEDGQFKKLSSITIGEIVSRATCKNKDYFVFGGGAGVNKTYGVWTIENQKISFIENIPTLDIELICKNKTNGEIK